MGEEGRKGRREVYIRHSTEARKRNYPVSGTGWPYVEQHPGAVRTAFGNSQFITLPRSFSLPPPEHPATFEIFKCSSHFIRGQRACAALPVSPRLSGNILHTIRDKERDRGMADKNVTNVSSNSASQRCFPWVLFFFLPRRPPRRPNISFDPLETPFRIPTGDIIFLKK